MIDPLHAPIRALALLLPVLAVPALAQNAALAPPDSAATETTVLTQAVSPPDTVAAAPASEVSAVRTGLLAGGATLLGAMELTRRTQDERRLVGPFDVEVEWAYARGADKLGHIYSTGVQAEAWAAGYRWAGHSPTASADLGAITAFAFMLHYEVLDGYGRREVFDPSDVVSNAVGAGLVALRPRVPALEAARLKLSYVPSGDPCDASCDYEGQTMWLAVTPRRVAPEAAWLPPWLAVAVGYGVREGSAAAGGFDEQHVTLALDLDPDGLPLSGRVWEAVRPVLRRVHLPSPGVRLTPRPSFVLAF